MFWKTAQLLWGKLEATLQKYGASLDYDLWFGKGNSEFQLFRAGMSSGMEDICKDKNSCVDIMATPYVDMAMNKESKGDEE